MFLNLSINASGPDEQVSYKALHLASMPHPPVRPKRSTTDTSCPRVASNQVVLSSNMHTFSSHANQADSTSNIQGHDHPTRQRDVEREAQSPSIPSTSSNKPDAPNSATYISSVRVDSPLSWSPDLGLGVNDFGTDWVQDPLDFEWLTSAPFETEFESSIAETFVG